MSNGVTQINELPNSKNENIKLSIEENVNMNDIFKEVQNTGSVGTIPTRDIPMNTNNISLDETSKPNYIPEHDYYLDEQEFESGEAIIEDKRKSDNRKSSLEVLYEELQIPILLGVIYFIFQLPILNNYLAKYLSFTYNTDGVINLSGIVFKSVSFSIIYFILTRLLVNISD